MNLFQGNQLLAEGYAPKEPEKVHKSQLVEFREKSWDVYFWYYPDEEFNPTIEEVFIGSGLGAINMTSVFEGYEEMYSDLRDELIKLFT